MLLSAAVRMRFPPSEEMEIESALIIAVPEAEPLVKALRERFDWSAAQGVPAHITILYPFIPPEKLRQKCWPTCGSSSRSLRHSSLRCLKRAASPPCCIWPPRLLNLSRR